MLKKVSVILLLNKVDLFEKKMETSPIIKYFPDFKYDQNSKNGRHFFEKKFKERYKSARKADSKELFVHFTTNIDTQLTKFIIMAIESIMSTNIIESMKLE